LDISKKVLNSPRTNLIYLQNMKKVFLLCTFCLFVLGAAAQQAAPSLWIYSPTGAEQSVALENLGKITFTSTNAQFELLTGSPLSIALDDIAAITFAQRGAQSVPTVNTMNSKIWLVRESSEVKIESATTITEATVYNLQGAVVARQTPNALVSSISLSTAPAGVYLVRVKAGQNYEIKKIVKN